MSNIEILTMLHCALGNLGSLHGADLTLSDKQIHLIMLDMMNRLVNREHNEQSRTLIRISQERRNNLAHEIDMIISNH